MSKFKNGDRVSFEGKEYTLGPSGHPGWWTILDGVMVAEYRLTPAAPPKLAMVRVVWRCDGTVDAYPEHSIHFNAPMGRVLDDRRFSIDALDAASKRVKELEQENADERKKRISAESRAEKLATQCDDLYAQMRAAEARCKDLTLVVSSREASDARVAELEAQLVARDAKPGAGRFKLAKRTYDGFAVLCREDHPDFVLQPFPRGTRTEYWGDEHGNPVSDLIPLDELWHNHGIFISLGNAEWVCRYGYDRGWLDEKHPTHAAAHRAASDYAKSQPK